MAKTLGVIGGLGAETGFSFCSSVSRKIMGRGRPQPHIVLDSLAISGEEMGHFARGSRQEDFLAHLEQSARRLDLLGVFAIAMPCNTAHVHIGRLRAITRAPILSIIGETAEECNRMGVKKAGLLATTSTISQGLYASALEKHNIGLAVPAKREQEFIDGCIVRLNVISPNPGDADGMAGIAKKLHSRGADCVVLGCTDLSFLAPRLKAGGKAVVDSLAALEDASVRELAGQPCGLPQFSRACAVPTCL